MKKLMTIYLADRGTEVISLLYFLGIVSFVLWLLWGTVWHLLKIKKLFRVYPKQFSLLQRLLIMRLYFLNISSETVSLFRPVLLRADKTLLPFGVDMRSRKPCLFFLFLFDGWNVRFMIFGVYRGAKIDMFCSGANAGLDWNIFC